MTMARPAGNVSCCVAAAVALLLLHAADSVTRADRVRDDCTPPPLHAGMAVDQYSLDGSDLVGRRLSKKFEGVSYLGVIVSWMPPCSNEEALYHAVYHDGDEEDLDVHELTELLVPRHGDDKTPTRLARREKDLELHASAWRARWQRSTSTSVLSAGSV